jgi:hypothetical protein
MGSGPRGALKPMLWRAAEHMEFKRYGLGPIA